MLPFGGVGFISASSTPVETPPRDGWAGARSAISPPRERSRGGMQAIKAHPKLGLGRSLEGLRVRAASRKRAKEFRVDLRTARKDMPSIVTTTRLAISGMRSNSCREIIVEALTALRGVKDVSVSLIRAEAEVKHRPPCDPNQLVQAVVSAGYGASIAAGTIKPN